MGDDKDRSGGRPRRVRRFVFVILLTALATGVMFLGQTIGQVLQDNPTFVPWAIVTAAVILALGWERVTRRGR